MGPSPGWAVPRGRCTESWTPDAGYCALTLNALTYQNKNAKFCVICLVSVTTSILVNHNKPRKRVCTVKSLSRVPRPPICQCRTRLVIIHRVVHLMQPDDIFTRSPMYITIPKSPHQRPALVGCPIEFAKGQRKKNFFRNSL